MKWIARFVVFAVMFLGGLAAASSLHSSSGLDNCVVQLPTDTLSEPTPAKTPYGISVMYAGWSRDTVYNELMLRFVIYNGSGQTITFSAKSPERPFPEIVANGRKLPPLIGCGNGIQTFSISPGGSAEFHVYSLQFLERPRKFDSVTIGFYLDRESSEGKLYTSQPFFLPDKFRESIPPFRK